ncbi:DEP domain-containing protein 1B-like [Styela clava]
MNANSFIGTDNNNYATDKNAKITTKTFKATLVWNNLVDTFKSKMQCKKIRRNLKIYEECFTGSSAVDTMYFILLSKQQFGNILRIQVAKLFQKFIEQHLIEDIHGKWMKEKFVDSGKLYRFPKDPELSPLEKTAEATNSPHRRSISLRSYFIQPKLTTLRTKKSVKKSPSVLRKYSTSSSMFEFSKEEKSCAVIKVARFFLTSTSKVQNEKF